MMIDPVEAGITAISSSFDNGTETTKVTSILSEPRRTVRKCIDNATGEVISLEITKDKPRSQLQREWDYVSRGGGSVHRMLIDRGLSQTRGGDRTSSGGNGND